MLSVAKLTLGQEAYYEQQVARGLDDYYAGRGESPGIWAGSGSAALGLVGMVGDGNLGTLLRGVDPASRERLRSPVRERVIAVRTLDLETGEWREEVKALKPVSGFDLVFSCPKSVSLVHALTEDERVRREISEAHEASWQAALGYLEREACIVRRGKGGHVHEHGVGFVAAAFRHRTSRAQDPHLHTHVVVANVARTWEGDWRALDGGAILKTYRLAAGFLYEANLRRELTLRLGLEWTQPVKGMAELAAVPQAATLAFSTRRRSLLEHMEARSSKGFAAARVAALATRERKEQVELPRLREEWKVRAAEHGLGRRELDDLVQHRPFAPEQVELGELADLLLGDEGLAARQTSFTLPELVQAVAASSAQGATVGEVLAAARELARFPGVELLARGEPGRPSRYTTRELLAIERDALELALSGRDVGAPSLERRPLARTLMQMGGVSGEQRMLVHEASTRPDRVVCVVGVAGAGKTTALAALAEAHRESGIPVLGAAPSGRAADELQTATDIPSRTLHRLLLEARDEPLPSGCLLVVDEAAMAETRVLAPLLELVEDAEGKALLVGDAAQLPAVGAGGLFAALCEQLGPIELAGNRRQCDPVEREVLARLREGDPEPYLTHAARSGRLSVDAGPTATKQRLLQDWWQDACRDRRRNVMLAYRHDDVRDLNQAAHELMRRSGRLGRQAVSFEAREFRTGDRVVCRRNDARVGLRNGMRGTIVDLDETTLTMRDDNGAHRQIPHEYGAERLDYGYALTGHAAQGATVDRAYVLLHDQGALQEWAYVVCSRARLETRLYLSDHDTLERETPQRGLDQAAPPGRAARALQRSATKPIALHQRPERCDSILNPLEQQKQLERQRERTTQQLATARHKRESLRWWSRDRRIELQAEIAFHRQTLDRIDEKHEQLRRITQERRRKIALSHGPDEHSLPLQPAPARPSPIIRLECEPRALGLER